LIQPASAIDDAWIACHECDLLHRVPDVERAHAATCTRCGATLYRFRPTSVDTTLALTATGLILFVLSNTFPLLTFEMEGRSEVNSLVSGVIEFWSKGFWELSLLVLATSVLFPLINLLTLIYVLVPIKLGFRPPLWAPAFRSVVSMRPWAMMEVYMLGVFVAIVKLADFATIVPGVALYCFSGLIVVSAAAAWSLDVRQIWQRLEGLS
jgi:paraquat-inducible protein A